MHSILLFLITFGKIKNNIFQSQVKDLAYKKKAQPGLNFDHFKKIKIPIISKPQQDQIVAQIEPSEKKIKELKAQIKEPHEIIQTFLTIRMSGKVLNFIEKQGNLYYRN